MLMNQFPVVNKQSARHIASQRITSTLNRVLIVQKFRFEASIIFASYIKIAVIVMRLKPKMG